MAARARPSSTAPRRITKASSGSARSARSRRRAGGRRERTRRLRFSLLARSAAATFAALRGARLRARGLLAAGVPVGVPAAAPQREGGPRDQAPDGAATLVAGGTGRLGDALLHVEGAAARAAVLVSRHERSVTTAARPSRRPWRGIQPFSTTRTGNLLTAEQTIPCGP